MMEECTNCIEELYKFLTKNFKLNVFNLTSGKYGLYFQVGGESVCIPFEWDSDTPPTVKEAISLIQQ